MRPKYGAGQTDEITSLSPPVPMSRRYVNQLIDQEAVDAIFLARSKQLRPNRNGDLYLQVELADRTGTISARLWNADEQHFRGFENGDYVRVRGTAQMYQGAMQIIASHVTRARMSEVDDADFNVLASRDVERLSARLTELLRSIRDPHLSTLAECFLIDEEFMGRFRRAPAGVKNHHAYYGGLLEHVVTLLEVAHRLAECYPQLNRDLLLMGVLIHDMGKIEELSYDRAYAYTEQGELIGHLVLAVGMLDQKLQEAQKLSGEPMPQETALRLKHMIVSHHGEYEFGSPKLPMTPEALALSMIDNLDAKLHNFQQMLSDESNLDEVWTQYNPNLRRKLYRGRGGE
jgi:3'-5' exoribonuclease